jgi:DNA polymerase-1
MSSDFIAFDTETRLFVPGLLAPPIVVGSFAAPEPGSEYRVHGADAVCEHLRSLLDAGKVIVGANVAFDFGVAAAHDPSLLPAIFQAYEEGRVFDVLIAVGLMLIADGMLGKDPRNAGPMRSPSTGKLTERISLEIAVDLVLGRVDAKKNDFWRLRYAILENVPVADWPADALQYPLDDARNTIDVAVELIERALDGRVRNLHNMKAQARAAWALHLSCIWGLRTDADAVEALAKEGEAAYAQAVARFQASGIIDADGKQAGARLKRLVVLAYGGSEAAPCTRCAGTGRVQSEKTKASVICKGSAGGCDGTGLDVSLATTLPHTDAGGIGADRDTLKESGDDTLAEYGAVSETRKLLETYVPYLRQCAEHPLNPESNVLVASGRTSYKGLVQTMPRSGGVRACFVPRPGNVYASVDYNSVELCTLAQCCLWVVGRSEMADALNAGRDLHTAFAASMLGRPYDEVLAALKAGDKKAQDYRQASKPCNFGFPGGMGVAQFVKLNRKVGIRFCKILDGAEVCGLVKVTEWNKRPTSPICLRCAQLADELRTNWFLQWPEMRPYFAYISSMVDQSGELIQFISERVRGGLDFCNGANTLFQGLAADGAKHALWRVCYASYVDRTSPLYGVVRPVLFAHDEIFSEMRADVAHIAAPAKAEIMIDALREYVPDVKIGAAPALMRRWHKKAEPVYDTAGKLIPWEPKT